MGAGGRDDGSEDEYPPRKKAKKGKAKAKVKAAKPKKATTTKTRAQKNSKGSTSKASSSGGHESALNEAKKQFTEALSMLGRVVWETVAGKVVRVYSIRGTITVNWNPRLDDGKYDENPHADNVRNVQTAEEYLAGLVRGAGAGEAPSSACSNELSGYFLQKLGRRTREIHPATAQWYAEWQTKPLELIYIFPSSVRDTYGVFQLASDTGFSPEISMAGVPT
ncbi:hypothetical protein FA13DRAFT_1722632 [Coprinellus micaceus]|uniref:Uncharacterized protein n=1 Tax=Coprinellus micaceus TaxID=71717 RepID=A0A4Y7RJF1_COPMI|nr:hypothetical protein FA13DRAFT_1722632 [Coprinellus micaceus]